jgi:biofilm PGA synthesis N-glycosyltransferase PgaC
LIEQMRGLEQKILLVSPVFDEEKNLESTARALAAQAVPPDRWVVVDDGSRDGTLALAHRLAAEIDFMEVISSGDLEVDGADKLAEAREARAFNLGLAHAGWRDYDFVGKLDGDVELPPEWFATLLAHFDADPRLGLAGGRLVEADAEGGWNRIEIPAHHVHGAVKLFRRQCLEEIGGIPERLAWDTIDETYARMKGWEVRSFDDLAARHHRPWGSADGRLRGRARHGECAWILHYDPLWVTLRSVKVGRSSPPVVSGAAFLYGYVRAATRGVPRIEDPEFRSFTRDELRSRMRRAVSRRQVETQSGRKIDGGSAVASPVAQGVEGPRPKEEIVYGRDRQD